jgi:hypothetical protein
VPVTLGNIVGAALFVAAIYWYIYIKSPLCTPKVSEINVAQVKKQ